MKPPEVEPCLTIPADSVVSLESILCTEELQRRPTRPTDYTVENKALSALIRALISSARNVLQTLADTVLQVIPADSAGQWQPHIGGGTPRETGLCGDVLDFNIPLFFKRWEWRYRYLSTATPLAEEGFFIPFYIERKAVGTIWAIAYGDRQFDKEDLRLLENSVECKLTMEKLNSQLVASNERSKLIEQKLAQSFKKERDAEAANRMKDEFLATLSHELRTPLNSVITWFQMIQHPKFNIARLGHRVASFAKQRRGGV